MKQYRELDRAAEIAAAVAVAAIVTVAGQTESEMPYKNQAVLEKVIAILQAKV